MAEFIFIHPHELDRTIAALYAASEAVIEHDRDLSELDPEDFDAGVLERAADLIPLIDDDGNVMPDLTLVMPAAFVRFVERDALYLAVIDFEGIAGVIDASEDPRVIPSIIRNDLRQPERSRSLDEAIGLI